MSSDTSLSLPDGLFAPHEVVRQLGARVNPIYALRQAGAGIGGKKVLAVGERFANVAEPGSAGEALVAEARRIATLASPNLARVRDVTVRDDHLVVIGELVEGEKLQELWRPEKLPLEIALRVVVDVLAGVGALHNLRDAKQQPMKLAHGEVSPATVVLGVDGIARLLHAVSRRAPGSKAEQGSIGYLAPEVATGEAYDARADVFAAGVLLWEALSGKPLLTGPDGDANARRVRSGPLPAATVPDGAPWAKGLVEVAAKALSAAPDSRWPTAAVMAAELRKAAGLKLAPASTVAAFARSAFGERVKARRESLESASTLASMPAPAPAPTPASPPVVAAPAAPPAPVVASAPVAPPVAKASSSPPEGSFIDVDLESAIETVDVVPGIRAPVAEVVELESDNLLEAPASSYPPAASSAVGGFVRDPFASPSFPRPAPVPEVARLEAPLPPVAAAPVVLVPKAPAAEDAPPASITGAPHFAAAMQAPAPPAPVAPPVSYAAQPSPVPAMLETLGDEDLPPPPGMRRRKVAVLGGVAALGLVIFALAGLKLVQRDADVTTAASSSPPATASIVPATPPAPRPTVTAAATDPSVAAPMPPPAPTVATTAVPVTPPAAVTTAAPTSAPVAVTPAPPTVPAAKPAPVVAPVPTVAVTVAAPPATPKPRPKPTFDPNTL